MAGWRDAANDMYIPYDDRRRVHPQADGFTEHQVWDFDNTPRNKYPLLLHVPYFDLYRKQVVKQADLVLAMHLRGDAFTPDEKQRNFDYYEALTVRDSSLSACTQAVLAAEVGHVDLAYDYAAEAALMDLRNLQHNTRDGLHIASLAGTWIALVAGFGGMRDHGGRLAFAPRLPGGLSRLVFSVVYRGCRLHIDVRPRKVTYRLADDESVISIHHYDEELSLTTSKPVTRPIPQTPSYRRPKQPKGREPVRRHDDEE
jgi:alpha,alpha-trehalose phosphorylase